MGDLDTATAAAQEAAYADGYDPDFTGAVTAALAALQAEGWEIVKLEQIRDDRDDTPGVPIWCVVERLDTPETE